MTLQVSPLSPAQVLKPDESLFLVCREVEGDFRLFPFVVALPLRGFPDDAPARFQLLDLEFLAEALEVKFKRVPDLGTAAPRVRCSPLSELFGLGQKQVDL